MKIIDESKLRGSPNSLQDEKILRIFFYKRIKKFSNGEKLFLIKKGPFYNESLKKDTNLNYSCFFRVWNSVIKAKKKNGEIRYIEFNNKDWKVKNIGSNSENITEINSIDPRLILIWNWNPNIKISIWFKNRNEFSGNKYEFKNLFPVFDITNKKDWIIFLNFFLPSNHEKLKGVGWKSLIKRMKSKNEENISDETKIKIKDLLKEMA